MTASTRTHFGRQALADEVGLARWQLERAAKAGMLPAPAHSKGWRPEQVQQVRDLVAEIVQQFGADHPVGLRKCAIRLADRLGVPVTIEDVAALVASGHLTAVEQYDGHDLYAPAAVDALAPDMVTELVNARTERDSASIPLQELAQELSWHLGELITVLVERQVRDHGPDRRIPNPAADRLRADPTLHERVLADRTITAYAAAQLLQQATEDADGRRQLEAALALGLISAVPAGAGHETRRNATGPWYRTGDVTVLADQLRGDPALRDRVRAEQTLTADAAARLLEDTLDIEDARRHFDLAVKANLIGPVDSYEVGKWGREITVPLYRTGDVKTLAEHPVWRLVAETGPGERSPIWDLVTDRPPERATLLRRWLRDLGETHGVDTWGFWRPKARKWEIDWERHPESPLTREQVLDSLAARPELAPHRRSITIGAAAGAAINFARAMLEPGTAVILDVETTSLHNAAVVDIAVIDAHSGKVLLNTLVNPGGVPIEPGAFAVHGITDAEVTAPGIPGWPTVYKRLLKATKDRIILAYNAEFDCGVITAECQRHGMRRSRLADPEHWADVMVPRAEHADSPRLLPNGGDHRALGDVRATREHLIRMTNPLTTATRKGTHRSTS